MTWESRICKVCLENLQNFALLFATYSYKAEMRIFGFSWLFQRSLNILQIFLHILIGNVKGGGLYRDFRRWYRNRVNDICFLNYDWVQAEADSMVEDLRAAFKDLVGEATWMDEETQVT